MAGRGCEQGTAPSSVTTPDWLLSYKSWVELNLHVQNSENAFTVHVYLTCTQKAVRVCLLCVYICRFAWFILHPLENTGYHDAKCLIALGKQWRKWENSFIEPKEGNSLNLKCSRALWQCSGNIPAHIPFRSKMPNRLHCELFSFFISFDFA